MNSVPQIQLEKIEVLKIKFNRPRVKIYFAQSGYLHIIIYNRNSKTLDPSYGTPIFSSKAWGKYNKHIIDRRSYS